jgi:hypothetical protein
MQLMRAYCEPIATKLKENKDISIARINLVVSNNK